MLVSGPHGHQAPHTATCLTFLAGEIMTGASTVNCPAAGVDNDRDIGNLLNLSYYELLKDLNLVTITIEEIQRPSGLQKHGHVIGGETVRY